jgi:hypothetical protein
VKLVAVAAMMATTAYHDLSGSRLAARGSALLGVVVVALAVFLVRGLPG